MGTKEARTIHRQHGTLTKSYVTQEQLDDVLRALAEPEEPYINETLEAEEQELAEVNCKCRYCQRAIDHAADCPCNTAGPDQPKDTPEKVMKRIDKIMVEAINLEEPTSKDETKRRAMEGTHKHWVEICEKAAKGTLGSCDITSSSCPCCTEYYSPGQRCPRCPLSEPWCKRGEGHWCCGGRWEVVYDVLNDVSDFSLQQACEAVRDYIKEKLDELEPGFGVGDIVRIKGEERGSEYSVGRVNKTGPWPDAPKRFKYSVYYGPNKDDHQLFTLEDLELIYPAPPKELNGVKVGEIVETIGGIIGRMGDYINREVRHQASNLAVGRSPKRNRRP